MSTEPPDVSKRELYEIVKKQQRQLDALADHVGIEDTGLSRRDIIQAGAGAGAAGLLFGASAGPAAAEASTSDSDGDLGTPSNRSDLFADGVDFQTLEFDHGFKIEEDDNSPFSASGSQSHTFNLSGSYDEVLWHVDWTNNSGNAISYQIRINGDSGNNYDSENVDGGSTSGASEWTVGSPASGESVIGDFAIVPRLGGLGLSGPALDEFGITMGENSNVSSPLNSVTFRGSQGPVAIDARALGVTL